MIYRSRVTTNLSVLQRIEFNRSAAIHIKTFSTLSRVKMVFWISRQLHILCTSAVK